MTVALTAKDKEEQPYEKQGKSIPGRRNSRCTKAQKQGRASHLRNEESSVAGVW